MADDLSPEAIPLVPVSSQPQAPNQPVLEPWAPPAPAQAPPLPATEIFTPVTSTPPAPDMFSPAPSSPTMFTTPPPVAPPPPVDGFAPQAPAPPVAQPAAQGWGIREQAMPQGVVPPPPMAGAPGAPWAPAPPPPPVAPKRKGGRGLLATLTVILLIVDVKVGLGLVAKDAISATNKTYHAPATISGAAQSTDPALTSALAQLKQGFELPSLQNSHTEAAAYVDSSGHPAYILAFGQDNAGRDEVRQNAGITAQYPDVQSSTIVNQSDGGINVSCGTVNGTSGTYQGCTWYNDNAFGDFIDYGSSTPAGSASILMSTLKTMVA